MKLFCNTTLDGTGSLVKALGNNNQATIPSLFYEDILPVEIIFIGEGGGLAQFVGQAGNEIKIAIGNLSTREILTQATLDQDQKATLDLSTTALAVEMFLNEQKTLTFEIQICYSTGKTETLCQVSCSMQNQLIGTELIRPAAPGGIIPTIITAPAAPGSPILEISPTAPGQPIILTAPAAPSGILASLHYEEDPNFIYPDDYDSTIGAHRIILLQSYTENKTGNLTEYPIGSIWQTTGGPYDNQIRAEDPGNPRQTPYVNTTENLSSGAWGWFPIASRSTQWQFAKELSSPAAPSEPIISSSVTYEADPDFNFPTDYNINYFAHRIIFLQNYNYANGWNTDFNKIYLAGETWQTAGRSTDSTLLRAEDPENPRDKDYTGGNQGTGAWNWFYLNDRGTTWDFAKEV